MSNVWDAYIEKQRKTVADYQILKKPYRSKHLVLMVVDGSGCSVALVRPTRQNLNKYGVRIDLDRGIWSHTFLGGNIHNIGEARSHHREYEQINTPIGVFDAENIKQLHLMVLWVLQR